MHFPAAQIPVEESGFVHGVPSSATDFLTTINCGFSTASHTSSHGVTPDTLKTHEAYKAIAND